MKELPESGVYEEELKYMPYRESLAKVLEIVSVNSTTNANLLDLMCGPGFLLGKLSEMREDIAIHGVDIDQRYIEYAKDKYPSIKFEQADILSWEAPHKFDTVICTGALHHLPYEDQPKILRKIPSMIKPHGLFVLSDCYVSDYSNELERQLAASELGYEYLKASLKNGSPNEITETLIDIMHNDVLKFEFKTSLEKRLPIIKEIFGDYELIKTWPSDNKNQGYGDYIIVVR